MSEDAQENREQLGGLFDEPQSPPGKRDRLHGGILSPNEALKLLNSHYLIGKSEQEVAIFRINNDGSLAFAPPGPMGRLLMTKNAYWGSSTIG